MFKYNYVIFNATDNKFKIDHDGYYTICLEDLYNNPDVIVVSWPLDYAARFVRYCFNIHNSSKINKIFKLPFKQKWYPYYFNDIFKNEKPYCFILISRQYPLKYLHYLKLRYPNCKIVLLHRDLVSVCELINPALLTCKDIDLQMSFDKGESKLLGIPHFDEFESKIKVPVSVRYPESDVFFAGKAKNRLNKLLKVYKTLSSAGLKCKFFLTEVEPSLQISMPGIKYSSKNMSYKEMLYHSVNSRCILEINQDNADGYTSRFLEAVMFNKRLITDNLSVENSKFYSSERIQIVKDYEKIDCDFIMNDSVVDYHYRGEFSPIHLLYQIDQLLK